MSPPDFGATSRFPDGKLGPADDGELIFGITADSNGLVHVNFGKDVSWFAMPPETAIDFARKLLEAAGAKKVEITL